MSLSNSFKIDVANYLLAAYIERQTEHRKITGFTANIWDFVFDAEGLIDSLPGFGAVWEVTSKGIEWLENNGFKKIAKQIASPVPVMGIDGLEVTSDLVEYLSNLDGTEKNADDPSLLPGRNIDDVWQTAKDLKLYAAAVKPGDRVSRWWLTEAGQQIVKIWKHRVTKKITSTSKLWGTW